MRVSIISKVIYSYPSKGRWIVVDIYWDANLPNQLDKTEKGTFCKLKASLSRNFVYSLQTFGGFCQVHFTILLQIQHENNFLPTSEHRQAKLKFVVFLVFAFYDCFMYRTNVIFQKIRIETRRHFGSIRKTVNNNGYSELQEPIKTCKNCSLFHWFDKYEWLLCRLRKLLFNWPGG